MENKILEKVRKLLAMANHETANETERETALRQAHALLTKHGLDMVDVSEHERSKMDPRGHFEDEDWGMPWTRTVRQAIAELFMCKYIVGHKVNATRSKHHFVGRESNATTAMYMSAFVVSSILKEGRSRYTHNLSPQTRAFAQGAANKIYERVQTMIAQKVAEVQASDGKGLALVDLRTAEDSDNEGFVSGWNLKKCVSRDTKMDAKAYRDGQAHGNTIGLNVQVSTTEAAKQINHK